MYFGLAGGLARASFGMTISRRFLQFEMLKKCVCAQSKKIDDLTIYDVRFYADQLVNSKSVNGKSKIDDLAINDVLFCCKSDVLEAPRLFGGK